MKYNLQYVPKLYVLPLAYVQNGEKQIYEYKFCSGNVACTKRPTHGFLFGRVGLDLLGVFLFALSSE
jgi:hypothetical protein